LDELPSTLACYSVAAAILLARLVFFLRSVFLLLPTPLPVASAAGALLPVAVHMPSADLASPRAFRRLRVVPMVETAFFLSLPVSSTSRSASCTGRAGPFESSFRIQSDVPKRPLFRRRRTGAASSVEGLLVIPAGRPG